MKNKIYDIIFDDLEQPAYSTAVENMSAICSCCDEQYDSYETVAVWRGVVVKQSDCKGHYDPQEPTVGYEVDMVGERVWEVICGGCVTRMLNKEI